MQVTKIEQQQKSKGRYSVFVDDKFAFGLSEAGLINSGIKVGLELNKEKLEEFKQNAKTDKIYNQTLSLIMRRPRSRWEIEDYLKRKNAIDVSEEIIQQLESRGLINDDDFARRWIENRRLLKPTSKRKLQYELRQKRVSDSAISKALQEDEISDQDTLKQEIEKKRQQSRYKDETKLMSYLARQGYRYEDIKKALAG